MTTPDMPPEPCTDIPALLAALQASERALDTQKKVADTFKQCLTDTYRPHIEENKQLRHLISLYDSMVLDRDNTIARAVEVAEKYAAAGWRQTETQSVDQAEGMNIAAEAVLAALTSPTPQEKK